MRYSSEDQQTIDTARALWLLRRIAMHTTELLYLSDRNDRSAFDAFRAAANAERIAEKVFDTIQDGIESKDEYNFEDSYNGQR